jgi:TIR domain
MKVFVSWSGELSKRVAQLLCSWIEDVLQGTKTWISTDDIDKGSIWFGDIASQLADTSVGILCLTRENMSAPWVLFEAGALSKGLTRTRVCPLLVNLSHTDLRPPLSQFNGTLPVKDDMTKLVKTINGQNGDKALSEEKIEKAVDRWWDEFAAGFAAIQKEHQAKRETHRRGLEGMVEEILEITRSLQRSSQEESLKHIFPSIFGDPATGKSMLAKYLVDSYVAGELAKSNPWYAKLQAAIADLETESRMKDRGSTKDGGANG